MSVDARRILGIAPDAGPEEAKAARRKLLKDLHPDVNPTQSAAHLTIIVNEAFDAVVNGPAPIPRPEASDYTFPFGKYKGWTLATVHAVDPQYLEWIMVTFDEHQLIWKLVEAFLHVADPIIWREAAVKRAKGIKTPGSAAYAASGAYDPFDNWGDY